jgi:N-acetylneuraminate synthase/N,N'-diacetyllegionaminate synthase
MVGPDHLASLVPEELKQMITSIRNIEKAISGSGIKQPSDSEKKNIAVVRKSLHYKVDLIKGATIEKQNLITLRPGNGISPMNYEEIIGKTLSRNVLKNELIKTTDFI